jgi:hypothetical protein
MKEDYEKLMINKSDEELQEYVEQRLKYSSQEVYSAIGELKKRGRSFTEEEINSIKPDLEQEEQPGSDGVTRSTNKKWDKNVTKDNEAIELYSQKAINGFSIAFGVFFGSILLAINSKRNDNQKSILDVLAFGIIFTLLQIWLLSSLPRNTGLTLIFNFGGASILNYYFWKRNIGEDTQYRKKKIWTPLIIGAVIATILIVIIIATQK